MNKIPFARPVMTEETIPAVSRVLRSGWVTTGPECAAFEEEFAAWVGADHAVTVSSCTAALELALRGLHLDEGARVLIPSITFCGAVEVVTHAGLVPVLADVDRVTGTVTAETCAAAVRECGGVDALMVLHFAGYPAQVEELAEACGVPMSHVIEDAAHGLGTWVDGRQVGAISRATCFSFYATKNLPIGEGGMITTDDGDLAAWFRQARMHGMSRDAWRRYLPGGSWKYTVREAGLKANLSDVQAAIGRAQLRKLSGWQRHRDQLAAKYTELLSTVPGLQLPRKPDSGRHAWHLYPIRVRPDFPLTRNHLVNELGERGVGTSVHFIPAHHMPRFRDSAVIPVRGLPGADHVFEEILSLPMHQGLFESDVELVCDAIADLARPVAAQEVA